MTVIELVEEQDCYVSTGVLSEAAAKRIVALPGGPIQLNPPTFINDFRYVLRSKGCIGVIPIDESVTLRIAPKVPISNVFRMLEYAYDLESFSILDGKNLSASLSSVFENLALILARRVLDRVRKGLHRDYIEETDSLVVPRGRLLFADSMIGQMRGAVRLTCRFEEHTVDLEDNRILGWTLHQLGRVRLERQDVRRAVREANRAVAAAIDVHPVSPRACIGRFYDRLNDDYRPLHGLCRFFLEHCGPSIDKGGREFLPFRLDMPKLFEAFVERWLRAHLPAGLRLDNQFEARLDEGGQYFFEIDLVISDVMSGKALAVLDTKYKRAAKASTEDLQQIIAYAARMQAPVAFLIYPSALTERREFDLKAIAPAKVLTTVFDLAIESDEPGHKFLRDVLTALPKAHRNL